MVDGTEKTEAVKPFHEYGEALWSEPKPVMERPPLLIAIDELELNQFCKLSSCIRSNDKESIKRLLKYGVENLINYVHPYDDIGTALGIAADNNDDGMMAFLLEMGANPNVVDLKGRTAATRASEYGYVESLKVLMEAGTDMTIVDEEGNGVLFYCIGSSRRHVVCAEICLDNGAQVNIINKQGRPLFVAHCENSANNEDVCLLMLAHDADPSLQDLNTRRTAIMAAAASGSIKVSRAILEKGISNLNETMEKTDLHVVHEAAKAGNLEILKILSAYGADFNQRTNHAYCHSLTPLHMAANYDKSLCCLFAGQRGSNALLKNREGLTPFQLAKKKGFRATAKACKQAEKFAPRKKPPKTELWLVKLHDYIYFRENQLLEEFEKFDQYDNFTVLITNFWTVVDKFKLPVPLDKASSFNELVGKHMTDENHVNYVKFILGGQYIPKKMLMSKFQKKVKKLKPPKKSKGKPNIPICQYPPDHARFEYIDMHQEYVDPLRFDRDRNPKSEFENDCFWYVDPTEPRSIEVSDAVRHGDVLTVNDALECGNTLINARSKYMKTPLMTAIMNTDIEMVKYLISKGANVNLRDNFLWTPLHMACHVGSLEILQLLLQNGAKNDLTSINKATPLMRAIESNSLDTVKHLLTMKTKTDVTDRKGATLQELAAAFADYFVFQLIPRPDDKQKKKESNQKKKKKPAASQIAGSMNYQKVEISVVPPFPRYPCSFPPIYHYSRMIEMSSSAAKNSMIDEKLFFVPHSVWTKQKSTEELMEDKLKRRQQLGWTVDFEDHKTPFLQNIYQKAEEIEREQGQKFERPILKKKPPRGEMSKKIR